MGVKARKQLPRKRHGKVNQESFPADPLALLAASMVDRVPQLVPLKYERMAASPFGFLRGAVPIMAADLASQPNSGLTTQLCGDAHLLNLGAYAGAEGQIVFDINDFDETIHGPFEWDVKRLATSLLLAGREAKLHRVDRREAVHGFVASYTSSMRLFSKIPVIELARFQIRRLAHVEPFPTIFRQAERGTPARLFAKLTRRTTGAKAQGGARRIRMNPPLLTPLAASDREAVLLSLHEFAAGLAPERRHFFAQYKAIDAAFKVVGTGSVGLRNYAVYLEGQACPANVDPLFLEVKEEPDSAYARYLPEGTGGETHQGRRVMNGQRALQLTSDPFLGYTTLEGRDYVVRQLNDHKASLDVATLTSAGLHGYAVLCGELLARGHARAGDPVSIASYIGTGSRFGGAILQFANIYADKTERDWALLKHWLKKERPSSSGAGKHTAS